VQGANGAGAAPPLLCPPPILAGVVFGCVRACAVRVCERMRRARMRPCVHGFFLQARLVHSGVYPRKEADQGACRQEEAQRHQDAEPHEEDSTRPWMAALDADAGAQAALMRASSGGMHAVDDSSMLQAHNKKSRKSAP